LRSSAGARVNHVTFMRGHSCSRPHDQSTSGARSQARRPSSSRRCLVCCGGGSRADWLRPHPCMNLGVPPGNKFTLRPVLRAAVLPGAHCSTSRRGVFFRCISTFDARHSLNRFPFAGSVTQQENEIEHCAWLDRKATTFCVPKSRDATIKSSVRAPR